MTSGTNNYKEMRRIFDAGLAKASESGSAWETFLEFYGRHTNLPFTSAVCAWQQSPDAGELRPFADWSRDRWKVRKGEHGILGQDMTAPGKHMFLFDEAHVEPGTDKEGRPLAPPAPVRDWSLVCKHADVISAMTSESPRAGQICGIAPAAAWLTDLGDKRAKAIFKRRGRDVGDGVLSLAYRSALYALLVRAGETPVFDIGDADIARLAPTELVLAGKCATVMTESAADGMWLIAEYLEAAYGNWSGGACDHVLVPASRGNAADWLMQDDGRVVEVVASNGAMSAAVLEGCMPMVPVQRSELDFTRKDVLDDQVRRLGFDPETFNWKGGAHAKTMLQMMDASLRQLGGGDPTRASIERAAGEMRRVWLERADVAHSLTSGMQHYCAAEIAAQVDAKREKWGLDAGYGAEVVEQSVRERMGRALDVTPRASREETRKEGRDGHGPREPGSVPEAVIANDEKARRALGREPNRVRYEGEEERKRPGPAATPLKDEAEAREASAAAVGRGRQATKTKSVRK